MITNIIALPSLFGKGFFKKFQKEIVGFTMMCDTGGGAVEMRKTAVRFPHIPTALLRCLRRFFRIERKKGGK